MAVLIWGTDHTWLSGVPAAPAGASPLVNCVAATSPARQPGAPWLSEWSSIGTMPRLLH